MEVREIIRVMDDGTQDKMDHGAVIDIQNDSLNINCLNIMPVDVVRIAIGIVKVVHEMGMDDVMKQMYDYCEGNLEWEDAVAETEEL